MKIKPLEDNLLIKRDKSANKTSSGIMLITNEQSMEKGTVVSLGEKVESIKKGDEILFKNYALDIIELDGEELVFIKRENILAVVS